MPDFSDEKYDFKNLLYRMLELVPNTLDKREGSVIRTTIAPNARILSQLYDLMQINQDNQYADTADRYSLIRLCKIRNIIPYPAQPTTIIGNFYEDMVTLAPFNPTSGDTFIAQDTNVVFKVTTKISEGKWKLDCTTPGEIGNISSGTLIPTTNAGSRFAGAEIESIDIYGENAESTEHLRERYVKSFETKAYSGNRAFYKDYTEQLPGVGGAKIYRAYQNQGGHVGVCITNSNGETPSEELIGMVQNKLDPLTDQGEGIGVAPIDHIVTVFGASPKTLNVDMTLTCIEGTIWKNIEPAITQIVNDYFNSVAKEWANTEFLIIRNVKLQAKLLSIPEILDITSCTINGQTGSIELQPNEVPITGTITGTIA